MKVKTTYRPSGYRVPQLNKAYDAGLRAAARVQQAALIDEFASRNLGYVFGEYATGEAAYIRVSDIMAGSGIRRIQVYTAANRDGRPYPFFWEFGHNNKFSKQWEHQPIFQPVLEATAEVATQAGWKAFTMRARTMPRNAA